jgi:hypothetical protein
VNVGDDCCAHVAIRSQEYTKKMREKVMEGACEWHGVTGRCERGVLN